MRLAERNGGESGWLECKETKKGIEELKQALLKPLQIPQFDFVDLRKIAPEAIERVRNVVELNSDFAAFQIINTLSED